MKTEKVKSFEAVLRDLHKEKLFSQRFFDKITRFQKISSLIGIVLIILSVPLFYLIKGGVLELLSGIILILGNGILLSVLLSMRLFSKEIKEFSTMRTHDSIYPIKKWSTPISMIPEQSIPPYYIKKMKFTKGQIIGLEWEGHSQCVFTQDTIITVLQEGEKEIMDPKSVWMSDTPQEYFTHWSLVARTKGPKVLIAGLGLGLLVHLLALRKDIERMVVIDLSPEIIQMVSPYLPENPEISVINGNFYEIIYKLLNSGEQFDTIICDIWKGIDEESQRQYEECKRVVEECYPNSVHLYWAFQTIHEQEKARNELS
jgi:hypothetical protein